MNALKEQLKETKALGFFTKISLKNQVDDLMKQFREYYQGTQAEDDFAASCKDGNRYRVYLNAEGRVVVEKLAA